MTALFASCDDDDRDTTFVNDIALPSNLELIVTLTQDNTGIVTFTPSGESVSVFTIDFGDSSEPVDLALGESIANTYEEGSFTVTVTGANLNGETTSITRELMVSFLPPENLEVTITPVSGDAFSIQVSATADLAVGFEVFFDDVENEIATPLMLGETATHTYAEVGTFNVRVIALAGGAATVEEIVEVVIENPVLLPIDFESTTIEYSFIDFGGAVTSIVDNPLPTGENTSATVAQFFKEAGAETFAGTVNELGGPIDFSEFQSLSISSLSPLPAGSTVLLKIENGTDPDISSEISAVTTVTDGWETLFFDFSGADLTQEYSRIIVFFDFGNVGDGSTFFFDNLALSEGPGNTGAGVEFPVDFEDPSLDFGLIGFEGAESTIEPNPFMTGINTSAAVVQTTKTEGAQFFAGTFFDLDTPIDFSGTQSVAVDSWSPKANIPVRLAIENQVTGNQIFVDVNTTVEDTWETLVFDFAGLVDPAVDYDRVVIFFEFVPDLPGDGSTYFYDNLRLQ